jgi:hypothetical protein
VITITVGTTEIRLQYCVLPLPQPRFINNGPDISQRDRGPKYPNKYENINMITSVILYSKHIATLAGNASIQYQKDLQTRQSGGNLHSALTCM